ncbi:hypothetical protein J6590_099721 [Homalodisca vitripennis]|nr:hypothetical protein J6590_054797 [Homalodisca vitripennis]KAG8324117.1 hypothetical protein J6590_099721 [Homalodisca vitripennis]
MEVNKTNFFRCSFEKRYSQTRRVQITSTRSLLNKLGHHRSTQRFFSLPEHSANPHIVTRIQFAKIRSQCKTLSRTFFSQYMNRVRRSMKDNPKMCWTHSSSEATNLFDDFFTSRLVRTQIFPINLGHHHVTHIMDVLKAHKNMDVVKGPGSDPKPPYTIIKS